MSLEITNFTRYWNFRIYITTSANYVFIYDLNGYFVDLVNVGYAQMGIGFSWVSNLAFISASVEDANGTWPITVYNTSYAIFFSG
jgi:hypothetical protein